MKPTPSPTDSGHQTQASSLALERLLGHMPAHVAMSFDEVQLSAIETALVASSWRRHPVDIRFSLPVITRRFYFVMLAGEEARSQERRRQERHGRPLWTVGNLVVVAAITVMGALALFSLMGLTQIDLGPNRRQAAPTAIPFIQDQGTCDRSGRVWENGKCLDFNHDPTF